MITSKILISYSKIGNGKKLVFLSVMSSKRIKAYTLLSSKDERTIEFFTINNLAVSVRSGRSKSELYVCLSVDIWYLKIQVHSRTSLLPLLVFIITLYISETSKNYNLYLPDLTETANFLIAKN